MWTQHTCCVSVDRVKPKSNKTFSVDQSVSVHLSYLIRTGDWLIIKTIGDQDQCVVSALSPSKPHKTTMRFFALAAILALVVGTYSFNYIRKIVPITVFFCSRWEQAHDLAPLPDLRSFGWQIPGHPRRQDRRRHCRFAQLSSLPDLAPAPRRPRRFLAILRWLHLDC